MLPTIRVYPADEGGCGYYRLIRPARALIAAGYTNVSVHLPSDHENAIHAARWEADDGRVTMLSVRKLDADVVVIQRPITQMLADVIPHLQAQGIAVVVEIDDLFSAISPGNKAFAASHPQASPNRNWQWLDAACRAADMVTCTTEVLAQAYHNRHATRVLPNYVPRSYLNIDRHVGPLSIGWSGSVTTHPNDLQRTQGVLAQIQRETGAEIRVVGTGSGVTKRLGVETVQACGWVSLTQYPIMMSMSTVGIVPLEPTLFNQAKSWLKGLEYAAVGVPFVASPTDPYRQLADAGIGRLASRGREWRGQLLQLLKNPEACEEESVRQRELVRRHYVLEDHAERWLFAWIAAAEKAADRRRCG